MMKTKYPRDAAMRVADELLAVLSPLCEPNRCVIAGSLRRGKAEVGDVEILYVSKVGAVRPPGSLFDETGILVDAALEKMLGVTLVKRASDAGTFAWGSKNKLARHIASEIPVDLFSTTEENWYNSLVCRTGGAETNKRLATEAQRRGRQWNVYGPGVTIVATDEVIPATSERHVFEQVGVPYLEPSDRT